MNKRFKELLDILTQEHSKDTVCLETWTRDLSQCSNTPPDVLDFLFDKSQDLATKELILKHPNTSLVTFRKSIATEDLLEILFKLDRLPSEIYTEISERYKTKLLSLEKGSELISCILANPNTPAIILESLDLEKYCDYVRTHPNISDKIILDTIALGYKDPFDLLMCSLSDNFSATVLEVLAQKSSYNDKSVHSRLLARKNCNSKVLDILITKTDSIHTLADIINHSCITADQLYKIQKRIHPTLKSAIHNRLVDLIGIEALPCEGIIRKDGVLYPTPSADYLRTIAYFKYAETYLKSFPSSHKLPIECLSDMAKRYDPSFRVLAMEYDVDKLLYSTLKDDPSPMVTMRFLKLYPLKSEDIPDQFNRLVYLYKLIRDPSLEYPWGVACELERESQAVWNDRIVRAFDLIARYDLPMECIATLLGLDLPLEIKERAIDQL